MINKYNKWYNSFITTISVELSSRLESQLVV